jgi:glycosyltransferase involved in cell wall biosynthesis
VASVLVLASDTIGTRMAGTGIRYWNLARVLASEHDVTLAAPLPIDLDPPEGVVLRWFDDEQHSDEVLGSWRAELITQHEIIVAQDIPYYHCDPETLASRSFVIDLYAPAILEKLEVARLNPEHGQPQRADDVRSLMRLMTLGDFFICASERQRDFWLGALAVSGRIELTHAQIDPELRSLIDCVPFGHPGDPPLRSGPGPREIFSPIGPDDFVLLWNGGLWSWLDPLTAIRSVAALAEGWPGLRLVFMGVKRPLHASGTLDVVDQAIELSTELGILDKHVFFNEWVDFDDRHNWLLDANAVISLHHATVESRVAFRTRVLDVLWCRTPIIATRGDVLADLVDDAGIGVTVTPGDSVEVQQAICRMMEPDLRNQTDAAFERLADEYTWERVAEPLLEFCREPCRVPKSRQTTPQDDYIHRLERIYNETADYARRLEDELARQQSAIESSYSLRVSRWLRRMIPGVE